MALNLITNPTSEPTDDSDWTAFVAREDVTNTGIGYSVSGFTLNEWDASSTDKPTVAEGTWIEVGGSIYQADSDTSLTDDSAGVSDGTCHIKLVISGDTVVPTLTNDDIPDWDAEKLGWYDGADKFLPYEFTRGSTGTTFTNKLEYVVLQNKLIKVYTTGAMDLTSSLNVGGAISVDNGINVSGAISTDTITSSGITTATGGFSTGSTALSIDVYSGILDSSGEASFTITNDASEIYGIAAVEYVSIVAGVSQISASVSLGSFVNVTGGSSLLPYRVIIFRLPS